MRALPIIIISLFLLSCAEASPQGRVQSKIPSEIEKCHQETKKAKKMADCLTIFLRDRRAMQDSKDNWEQPPIAVYLSEKNCTSKLPAKK